VPELVTALASFDPPAVVEEVVGRLNSRGWIEDSADVVLLTQAGVEQHERLGPRVNRVRQQVAVALPQDEYIALVGLLSRLVTALPPRPELSRWPSDGYRQAALDAMRRLAALRWVIMQVRWQQEEDRMQAIRIMPNLRVPDVEAAKSFYTDYLGLSTEDFNMGWVARFTSPATGANVQLVTRDATAREDSVISVQTDDVDGAYEEARELGYEIVHAITTEPWGVRRFLVRAPDGSVINVVRHRDWARATHVPVASDRHAARTSGTRRGTGRSHPRAGEVSFYGAGLELRAADWRT